MFVFSLFVLLLCTLWELCARFLIYILLFIDNIYIIYIYNQSSLSSSIKPKKRIKKIQFFHILKSNNQIIIIKEEDDFND